MSDKLKPCPFCGNKDINTRSCNNNDSNGKLWYIYCNNCGVQCGFSPFEEDVIGAWNKRING